MKSACDPVSPPARFMIFVLLVLLVQGCDTGVVTHDQTRAAELMGDFLSSLKSEEGIKLAYDWTDDRYKKDVSATDFRRKVARMRNLNQAQPSMVFPAAPASSIGCGRPARSRDSEPHPEPASPEACSTTELYSAGGQAGGEWRVPCDELGQSTSTLSTDRTVATNT